MMKTDRIVCALFVALIAVSLLGCDIKDSSDTKQQKQQEIMLQEGTSQVGMPAIKNFRERKILKDILELRDQEGLITYTYLFSQYTGKLIFLGESIGYGIPAATQFTNPQKEVRTANTTITLPQADPNGLFSPSSAEGTWILMREPNGKKVRPVYVEPRIVVSPFKLGTE
jgi:hypothetical protein